MLFAYTPAVLDPGAGSGTQVTSATLQHSLVNGADPKPGDTFTYTGTFKISAPEPGTTSKTVVTVNADPNAPFTATPTVDSFRLNGSAVTGTVSSCSTTTCTFTFTDLPAGGDLVFTQQAKVASPLPDGTVIMASAKVQVTTTPTWGLTNVSATAIPADQCSGTYTFIQRVEPSGSWLVDMKFGDLSGQGKVVLSPGDRTIRAWNDPLAAGDTIRFTDANGNDITAQVMQQRRTSPTTRARRSI